MVFLPLDAAARDHTTDSHGLNQDIHFLDAKPTQKNAQKTNTMNIGYPSDIRDILLVASPAEMSPQQQQACSSKNNNTLPTTPRKKEPIKPATPNKVMGHIPTSIVFGG